jgi:hypothetical protein
LINFTPLGDLILVRPDPLPVKIGSIHIPEGVLKPGDTFGKAEGSRDTFTGVVIAVGPGDKCKLCLGTGRRPIKDCAIPGPDTLMRRCPKRHPMPVAVGDRVLYPRRPSAPGGLADIVIDGETLMIFHAQQSAYAVVEA